MGITWQPVNPEKYESQRVVHSTFATEAPHEVVSANGEGNPGGTDTGAETASVEGSPYTGINVSTYYCDADTMVELELATLASLQDKTNVMFYVLEVACFTQEVVVHDKRTNGICLERQGVGFRIGVANWNIAFSSAFTLAVVAANAELNKSQTSIQVKIHGEGLQALPSLQPLLGMEAFNAESLPQISKSATSLADYFAQHGSTLKPVPLAIAPLAVTDYQAFKCFYAGQFATESIRRGKNVKQALTDLARHPDASVNVDPIFVRAVYSAFGLNNDSATPDPPLKQEAGQILARGQF